MKAKMFKTVFFVSMLVLVLAAFIVPMQVQAAPTVQGGIPPDVLNIVVKIVLGFASLVGVSQLVAVIVNLLKVIGLVKDGTADKWAAGLNLAFFIALCAFGVFVPGLALEILDGYAGQIAMVLLFILGFIVQITGSQTAHTALSRAGIPLIGKSFSKTKANA
jgi:hypothetical protein